jgi:hypothetical protein
MSLFNKLSLTKRLIKALSLLPVSCTEEDSTHERLSNRRVIIRHGVASLLIAASCSAQANVDGIPTLSVGKLDTFALRFIGVQP